VAIASPGALLPAVAWAFTRCAFLVLMVSKPGEGADFVSKLRRTERAPGEGARRAASIVFLFLIPYLPNHSLTAKRRTSCLHTHTGCRLPDTFQLTGAVCLRGLTHRTTHYFATAGAPGYLLGTPANKGAAARASQNHCITLKQNTCLSKPNCSFLCYLDR
jgi:hypothetical protein